MIIRSSAHICTEQGSPIYVIDHSEWRVDQDVSDILQHFSQGLLKYLKFGNLHLIPALLICYVHFNCSHFSVETEFTFGSDIGHSKFPSQADKGEHSWQLSGWCQLKVFCSILLKSFQNSCILKICMSFQRIEFKVYIFTAVIHWGSRMRVFLRTRARYIQAMTV